MVGVIRDFSFVGYTEFILHKVARGSVRDNPVANEHVTWADCQNSSEYEHPYHWSSRLCDLYVFSWFYCWLLPGPASQQNEACQ